MVEAQCKNISIGGMQVVSDSPRPQGSLVRFELELEEGVNVRGLGEVVWMRPGSGSEPGMGIKFRFIEQRDRQMIYKLVSEHIKERLAQKHPPKTDLPEPKADDTAPMPAVPAPAPEAAPAEPVPVSAPAPSETLPPPSRSTANERGQGLLDLDAMPGAVEAEPARSDFDLYGSSQAPHTAFEPEVGSRGPDEARYELNELYHPRPARRRDFPALPAVIILLLVGVVVAFLYWDEIVGPPAPPPVSEAMPATAEPPASVPDQPPPGSQPPSPQSATSTTETAPPPEPEPPPPEPEPLPPPPPSPPPPPRLAPFTEVTDVSWTRTPGGIKIEVTVNGGIAEERYSHFRLDGENPREVIRLTGVRRQFARDPIQVSGAPVSRIRVGYHPDRRELHVVMDMMDRSTRISRLRSHGTKLEVFLE